VTGGTDGDEAAWRDLITNYATEPGTDGSDLPWPERENLGAPRGGDPGLMTDLSDDTDPSLDLGEGFGSDLSPRRAPGPPGWPGGTTPRPGSTGRRPGPGPAPGGGPAPGAGPWPGAGPTPGARRRPAPGPGTGRYPDPEGYQGSGYQGPGGYPGPHGYAEPGRHRSRPGSPGAGEPNRPGGRDGDAGRPAPGEYQAGDGYPGSRPPGPAQPGDWPAQPGDWPVQPGDWPAGPGEAPGAAGRGTAGPHNGEAAGPAGRGRRAAGRGDRPGNHARVVRPARPTPDEPGDEDFVPPEPPPMPVLSPAAKGAWVALFCGPGYLLVATIAGWTVPGWAAFLAVAAFVGGFAVLVTQMGDRPPRDSGPDDGAVV
jgi:hypothetical protein